MLDNLWRALGGEKARFLPGSFSSFAEPLNSLTAYLLIVSAFFVVLIFLLMIVFCVKYRRRTPEQLAHEVRVNYKLELAWTIIPFALIMVAFFWGAKLYLEMDSPPAEGEAIYVYGKQWMWKFEHADGISEINELHVPVGKNIRLVMISQDVIHSLFIPEFRVKFDVLPGRYTRAWFQATTEGKYHILCSQYCGTDHSEMGGVLSVMSNAEFANWQIKMKSDQPAIPASAARGERIFQVKSCTACHDGAKDRAPSLHGVFGSYVKLATGSSILADEGYIRRSILEPNADIVAGYSGVMPTYAGQISESELADIISYLRFIGQQKAAEAGK